MTTFTVLKVISDGEMEFEVDGEKLTLPFEVICQAADQIRETYQASSQLRKKDCYESPYGYQPFALPVYVRAPVPPGDE